MEIRPGWGLLLTDERITYGAYLDRSLYDVTVYTLQPSTLRSYEYLIRDHIKPEIGDLRLARLRQDHLQSLYARNLESGLSPRMVQLSTLSYDERRIKQSNGA